MPSRHWAPVSYGALPAMGDTRFVYLVMEPLGRDAERFDPVVVQLHKLSNGTSCVFARTSIVQHDQKYVEGFISPGQRLKVLHV